MKRILFGASALTVCAGLAQAGGIERTTQSALVLYEKGNHAELSFGSVTPDVNGTSRAVPPVLPAVGIGNVANDYTLPSAAIKLDLGEKMAFALIFDKPWGADVAYDATNPMLGGTVATASSSAITALLKYQINPSISVFGGVRNQKVEGDITLSGAAYGAVSGYKVTLSQASATGYVVGAAYEKPEIALRVALTYNSAIEHSMATTESGPLIDPDGAGPIPALPLLNGTSTSKVKTPESWNLEFQSGVAANTLVFGSIRRVKHSQFRVDPANFVTVTGGGLVDLDDTTTYKLGVGRRFNEKFSGLVSVSYEAAGSDLVSPLAPTNGNTTLTVGGAYSINENVTLSGGVSYAWLGDAKPETGTPDVARADFTDNHAVGVGMKIAFKF